MIADFNDNHTTTYPIRQKLNYYIYFVARTKMYNHRKCLSTALSGLA